jgi:hypothetical protein
VWYDVAVVDVDVDEDEDVLVRGKWVRSVWEAQLPVVMVVFLPSTFSMISIVSKMS